MKNNKGFLNWTVLIAAAILLAFYATTPKTKPNNEYNFVDGQSPAPVVFTTSYNGAVTGNQNRRWEWRPSSGAGEPTKYWVSPSWGVTDGFYTTDTKFEFADKIPYRVDAELKYGFLSEGNYKISVWAVNDYGMSDLVEDTFTVKYINPTSPHPTKEMGVAAVAPYFPAGKEIKDAIGLRYKFKVFDNTTLNNNKIIFTAQRLTGSGAAPYAIEEDIMSTNVYYTDPVCSHRGDLIGKTVAGEAGMRVNVSDYVGKGLVGMKTLSPLMFPRQINLGIDGALNNTSRNEMISQTNLSNKEGTVTVWRGALVKDRGGWKCKDDLDSATTFREWNVAVNLDGVRHKMTFALPENHTRHLSTFEMFNPRTEFFNMPGHIKVYYWDIEVLRESTSQWEKLKNWQVTEFDGYAVDFGIRKKNYQAHDVIEISNDAPGKYLPKGSMFSLDY